MISHRVWQTCPDKSTCGDLVVCGLSERTPPCISHRVVCEDTRAVRQPGSGSLWGAADPSLGFFWKVPMMSYGGILSTDNNNHTMWRKWLIMCVIKMSCVCAIWDRALTALFSYCAVLICKARAGNSYALREWRYWPCVLLVLSHIRLSQNSWLHWCFQAQMSFEIPRFCLCSHCIFWLIQTSVHYNEYVLVL